MIDNILDSITNATLSIIDSLPDTGSFNVPSDVYEGISSIFSFVGWIMPSILYMPLISFILGLTAFRIAYAVYIHFKTH